jgi:RNA recognition motif-containing protein
LFLIPDKKEFIFLIYIEMNIYVGNLNYKVNEEDLKDIFEEYGAVSSSKIIMDKYSGRSKGFGFVTMDDSNEANKAIEELNGATLENRVMVVNEARPRTNRY